MSPNVKPPTVFVVDDDDAVRDSLKMLMRSVNLPVETFESATAFLEAYDPERLGCLLLDIRMPGMSGLDLRDELDSRRAMLPIIFVTGHGDVPMAVDAMQRGAMDFIQKPFSDEDLLDRIHKALERDAADRKMLRAKREIANRESTLTNRERQVMELVVAGCANKVIAQDLNLSQRTVEIHRARVMDKMKANSIAHLVRMSEAIKDRDAT